MAQTQNFNAFPDVKDNTVEKRFDTVENLDDGSEVTDVYAPNMTEMNSLLYGCIPQHSSRIEDFLRREVVLKQGEWGNEAKGSILWTGNFPKDLLAVSQNTLKVRGFLGMKARVRIQVKVNSTQFQAGCLGLYYIPYADYMPGHAKWIAQTTGVASENNLPCITSCPGVELDLSNNTSESFVTPYVSPYLYANLATGQGSFGSVYLVVLSPVASSAASKASYTVFANFEDVQLVCPTDAPVATTWAQSDSELRAREQTGTISGVVDSVGQNVANFLPKVGLGALSAPVAAATTVGTGLLRLLGMSKPTDQKPVTRVLQSPAHFFLNSDGVDTSHKLGLSGANETQVLSGFAGTSEDEMNIDYMCRRRGYIDSFEWKDTDGADTLLKKFFVSPRQLGKIAPFVADTKAYKDYPTIAGRVATMFSQWNGTIVYTFHFVKTQSHSGRIRFSFRPGNWEDETEIKDMIGYGFSSVVDLSAGTTVSFRVPFASPRPWLYTDYDRVADLARGDPRNWSTGTVTAVVVNPLRAASTVSGTVDVLVFAHMEDAQFAGPVLPISIPAGLPDNSAQMMAATIPTDTKSMIAGAGGATSLLPGAVCLGENIPSLRPLMKRYSYVGDIDCKEIPATVSARGSSGREINIFPWVPVVPPPITSTPANFPNTDFYSHLYSMYSFVTGPIRYKIVFRTLPAGANLASPIFVYINANVTKSSFLEPIPDLVTNPAMVAKGPVSLNLDKAKVGETQNVGYQPRFGNYSLPIYLDKEGAAEFEVPYYSTGHMVCTKYGDMSNADRRSSVVPVPIITLILPSSFVGTNKTTTLAVFRAAGDSMSFGGLLGSPGVYSYNYSGNLASTFALPTNDAQMANPSNGFFVQRDEFLATDNHPTMTELAVIPGTWPVGQIYMMITVTTDLNEWDLDFGLAFKVTNNSLLGSAAFSYTVTPVLITTTGVGRGIGSSTSSCFQFTVPANMLIRLFYKGKPKSEASVAVEISYSNNFFIPAPIIPYGFSNGGALPIPSEGNGLPVSIVSPTGLTGAVVVEIDPDGPPPRVEVQEPLWVTDFNET